MRVHSSRVVVAAALAAFAAAAGLAQRDRAQRFDYLVREDFFAGFEGDRQAFERAMKVCEEALRADPKHAEAMVWHGAGRLYLAGQAFQKQDFKTGGELWESALKEMADAVALQPASVSVLIPRGATLLATSRFVPPQAGRPLLETGLADYEKVYELQKPYFESLSGHARGELLFGLAEGWQRAGNEEKARPYFERIVQVGKPSGYLAEAESWLATKTLPARRASCKGCHNSKG
jgi:tetratricopeptide (TPR) repeat protein